MDAQQVNRLFGIIDDKDAVGFVSFLTPDATFRFGNAPPVTGHEAVHEVVAGFWESIAGSRHRLLRVWSDGDDVAVRGEVTYTRKDAAQVTIPFVNVLKLEGDKIREYSIHIDSTPLFANSTS